MYVPSFAAGIQLRPPPPSKDTIHATSNGSTEIAPVPSVQEQGDRDLGLRQGCCGGPADETGPCVHRRQLYEQQELR